MSALSVIRWSVAILVAFPAAVVALYVVACVIGAGMAIAHAL